jgi:hypothetical protein
VNITPENNLCSLITDTGTFFGHFYFPLEEGEVCHVISSLSNLFAHSSRVTLSQVAQRLLPLGDMRFLAVLSSCGTRKSAGAGDGDQRRLRIMSTENFSRSRTLLCKVMSGFQIISQLHSSLRSPLALLQTQRSAFEEGFIAPLRELQSIIARNGFTHTAQAELVTYAAHETASPSLSQWLEAFLRDTGVKRLQRCVASLRDSGTLACSSLSLISSNIVYILTEMRSWAAAGDFISVGLQSKLLTDAVEKGMELLQQLEQLQTMLTLHCSGARALSLWISNAFKLLAEPSTHVADFSVSVCKEAIQFVHARLWCKDVLDMMGSGAGSDKISASAGISSVFDSGSFNSFPASSAAPAAPQPAPIEHACAALKTACTACSAAVGHALISSIHPSFVADLPQQRGSAVDDVCVVQTEGQGLGVMMLSVGDSPASGALMHSVDFTRVIEAAGPGWLLEKASATVTLKVSDVRLAVCCVLHTYSTLEPMMIFATIHSYIQFIHANISPTKASLQVVCAQVILFFLLVKHSFYIELFVVCRLRRVVSSIYEPSQQLGRAVTALSCCWLKAGAHAVCNMILSASMPMCVHQ